MARLYADVKRQVNVTVNSGGEPVDPKCIFPFGDPDDVKTIDQIIDSIIDCESKLNSDKRRYFIRPSIASRGGRAAQLWSEIKSFDANSVSVHAILPQSLDAKSTVLALTELHTCDAWSAFVFDKARSPVAAEVRISKPQWELPPLTTYWDNVIMTIDDLTATQALLLLEQYHRLIAQNALGIKRSHVNAILKYDTPNGPLCVYINNDRLCCTTDPELAELNPTLNILKNADLSYSKWSLVLHGRPSLKAGITTADFIDSIREHINQLLEPEGVQSPEYIAKTILRDCSTELLKRRCPIVVRLKAKYKLKNAGSYDIVDILIGAGYANILTNMAEIRCEEQVWRLNAVYQLDYVLDLDDESTKATAPLISLTPQQARYTLTKLESAEHQSNTKLSLSLLAAKGFFKTDECSTNGAASRIDDPSHPLYASIEAIIVTPARSRVHGDNERAFHVSMIPRKGAPNTENMRSAMYDYVLDNYNNSVWIDVSNPKIHVDSRPTDDDDRDYVRVFKNNWTSPQGRQPWHHHVDATLLTLRSLFDPEVNLSIQSIEARLKTINISGSKDLNITYKLRFLAQHLNQRCALEFTLYQGPTDRHHIVKYECDNETSISRGLDIWMFDRVDWSIPSDKSETDRSITLTCELNSSADRAAFIKEAGRFLRDKGVPLGLEAVTGLPDIKQG